MPRKTHGNTGNKHAAKDGPKPKVYSSRYLESDMDKWRAECERQGVSFSAKSSELMNAWADRQKSKRKSK